MSTPCDVLILDPGSLTLSRTGRAVTVSTATSETITTVLLPDGLEGRAAVAWVLDRLLDGRVGLTRTVLADGQARVVRYRVALYNPHTAQVAVKPLLQTLVFRVGRPLKLPPDGMAGRFDDDVETLEVDGRTLEAADIDLAAALGAVESHRTGEHAAV